VSAIHLLTQCAHHVANAADAGDEMAQELLRNAASDLAALVKQFVDELHFRAVPFHLAKTGGTIGRCAFFDVELEKRRREAAPKATIGLPARFRRRTRRH
jgi:N-acetylglucosamine kinase-like BadF-type ATPase